MTRIAPFLAASCLALLGCGRTEQACPDCNDLSGSGRGGGGTAGRGGSGGVTGGGQDNLGGQPVGQCAIGSPQVPLARYSLVDLEWTLDEVLGPGPGFPAEGRERSRPGEYRDVSLAFVEHWVGVANARAQATEIDESALAICEADVADRTGCVDTWIRERGLRLYRRPLTDAQVDGYLLQFSELSSSSPLAAARSVLMSMLLSPYFVFRIELGGDYPSALVAAPGGAPPMDAPPRAPLQQLPPGTLISQFEIAARLSHFAARRAPDPTLLANAAAGQLLNAEGRLAQLERLQASPEGWRARALQHLEWLRIEDFDAAEVDGDAELASDLLAQAAAFISEVLKERDGSFTELLTSPRQPLNLRLAEHYGFAPTASDAFELVDLDSNFHAGVLGQGALLTRYGSPTHRGMFVLDQLLCSPIPPPPPNIDFEQLPYMGSTPRERISSVTSGQPCVACHSLMDPIGFALEAFDARGRLTGFDTSGTLRLPITGESVSLAGPVELGQSIAQSSDAKWCAAQRYFEYLLDRPTDFDRSEVDPWVQCFTREVSDGFVNLNQLARVVVASDALLRMRRAPSSVVGVGRSPDPVEHAREETAALLEAFPLEERPPLQQYLDALQQLQSRLPVQ